MRNILLALLLSLPVLAGSAHAGASGRHGTILQLTPIENRGDDENESVRQHRRLGRVAGTFARLGLIQSGVVEKTGDAGAFVMHTDAIEKGGEKVGERIGGPGPTTRYMIKVRLDSKKVLSITQLRQQVDGLKVGSRVVVHGTGDEATVSAE